jgi:hypothetical protein
MAYGTNTSGNAGQVAIDRFAEMMIARMEQMKASDWKKGLIPFVPSRLITVPFSTTHQSVLVEPLSAMSIIS